MAMNENNNGLNFSHLPATSSLAAHLIASQYDHSQIRALNVTLGDPCQPQGTSLPMQLHYATDALKSSDIPRNVSEQYPLEYGTPSQHQNSSEAPRYSHSLQNASCALSLTLPAEGQDHVLYDKNSGEGNKINNEKGNPRDPSNALSSKNKGEKSVPENGKSLDGGVRRRARRQRPLRTFGERSSQFRGVSRYRYTGRYEAFLWDNTDPQGKAKTVYVGVFDEEEEAARAYDLAALKFWGKSTPTNFPISDYENDLEEMQNMTKKEYLLSIRRKSKCFSKGASIYRGVSRNTDYTKWQARVGRGHGLRGIYLGTFDTEEEAARAYDIALIRFKGMKAVTNFDLSHYDVKSILGSNTLPIGKGASRLLKKTSVNDVISRRRKGSNDPMFGLQKDSSSSFQPHTQIQSFNQPETTKMMPSAQNQEVAFHQEDSKYANDHLAMTQAGIESPYWKGFKEMQQFERLQTLPTNPQAQNFKFHPQGCNDINQVLHQNPSSSLLSHGYQNPKFQVNPTIFLHQFMPSIGSGVETDENFSEKKLKGVGPIEPFEHFQGTLSNPQDQTFDHFHEKCNETSSQVQHQNPTFSICHGYQNPLFQINPNLFLGLTDIGSATGTHATLDGQLTDKGNISEKNLITIMDTIHGSSSGAGAWSEIQQVQPFDQHFQTQHPQNLHFHHIPKDTNPLMHQNPKPHANPPFLNGLVNGISGAGVSDSTRCTLFGGNPSSGFSISDGNSTIIMGKEGRMFSTSGRNGFPMIGASVGENSRREMSGEGGNGGWTENFGSDEPNINSPSSWLENFFKDADPPSFIL